MPVANWSVPATLASVYGDLSLNAATGDRYLLDMSGCQMWQDVRSQSLNVPQEDGSLVQERFDTGTFLNLKVQLWHDDDIACDDDLQRMVDTLSKHAHSMVKAAWSGRFLWDPDGADIRLLDYMQMLERMNWEYPPGGPVTANLRFSSPFPYAIDFTQQSTSLPNTLNNTGNTTFWPVFQISGGGPFSLSNDTTDEVILFTGTYSGYAEIDTFRNTIYQNGDGANLKNGLDVETSDFFGLVPGNNVISLAGATGIALWQAAWV